MDEFETQYLAETVQFLLKFKGCFRRVYPVAMSEGLPSPEDLGICYITARPVVTDLRVQHRHADRATKKLIERLSRAEAELAKARFNWLMREENRRMLRKFRRVA